MDTFEVGDRMRVRFISEELEMDLDLLHYLENHNVKPGQEVSVKEKLASAGLMVLEANGADVSLGLQVASRIRVETIG